MELILTDAASIDFDYWRKSGNVKAKRNIENLLQEIKEHPCSGTGHPEPLRKICLVCIHVISQKKTESCMRLLKIMMWLLYSHFSKLI